MRRIFLLISMLTVTLLSFASATAYAYDPIGGICSLQGAQGSSLCQRQGDTSQDPLTGQTGLIRGIANIMAFVAGLGAVITIIVAGFRYITANGDANKAKSARGAIIAAVVGLIIIALADSIISLVLSRV